MNARVKKMEYAVRGTVPMRADQIQAEIARNAATYSFSAIVQTNIGNPHLLGQKPLTFPSQVLSILNYPPLLEKEGLFPADVVERAADLLRHIGPGGLGAYSHSKGFLFVRQRVAEFLQRRDGFPSHEEDIFLTNGASPAIRYLLSLLTRDEKDAFLVPNPQYPLYSATIQELGAVAAPYDLDEANGWALREQVLEDSLAKGRAQGLDVRALVVINPGNPTGQCLSEADLRALIRFCARANLLLLADEVYQENVHCERPFISLKKILRAMEQAGELDGFDPVELVSFHSVSKGVFGECGRRGGYMELVNINPEVMQHLYKAASVSLCPNTVGQIMVELMVNPPAQGGPSHAQFLKEVCDIKASLKRRAHMLSGMLNSLEGVCLNPVEGALYAFPRITIPRKAVQEAAARGQSPDTMYALELLENTGIVVVPGSGFMLENGSRETAYYFRTTILPPEDRLLPVLATLRTFHKNFMAMYRDSESPNQVSSKM